MARAALLPLDPVHAALEEAVIRRTVVAVTGATPGFPAGHADRLVRSAVTIKAGALMAERDEPTEALDDLPEPPAREERTAPAHAWQYAEPTVPASAFWAVANRHR